MQPGTRRCGSSAGGNAQSIANKTPLALAIIHGSQILEEGLAAGQVESRFGVGDFVEGDAELAHRYIMLAAQLLKLLELLGRELRGGNNQLFNATVLEDFRKNHE